jgi:transposase
VARHIQAHWQEILNYLKHQITNSTLEGLNTRFQVIKNLARSFRSTRIGRGASFPWRRTLSKTCKRP